MRTPIVLGLFGLLAVACSDGGARPVAVALNAAPPPASAIARPPWPPRMRIGAVAVPDKLVLDGKLDEWGDLDAGALKDVVPDDPFPRVGPLGQGDVPPDIENTPSPKDADVRVGVAIAADGVRVAIDFGQTGLDTITVGLASIPPRASGLAYVQSEGDTSPPDAADALSMVAAPPDGAFTRELRVSKDGVELVGPANRRAALSNAEVRFDAVAHTLEARLPNAAVPELTEAPLSYLRMAVALRGPIPDDVLGPPWRWVELPVPVEYEPWSDLRERVIHDAQMLGPAGGAGLSYHPDEPLRIASADRSQDGYGPLLPMGVLFEKKATLGDIDVGLGYANTPYLVTLKNGVLHDFRFLTFHADADEDAGPKQGALGDGIVKGVLERNGEVHVITWAQTAYLTQITGEVILAHWTILRVDKEGVIRAQVCGGADLPFEARYSLGSLEPYANAGLTKFGWKRQASAGQSAARQTVLECAWDAKKQAYVERLTGKLPKPT